MLCQNCNLNEASIHLYTNVNGNQQQVDLCQNCYKIMKSDPKNPLNQFNQTGGSNFFDDFFSDLNNFRSSNGDLPNTPPTQEGGNRGNGGNTQGPGRPEGPRQQATQQPQGLLEEFGINITNIARRGDIDPVIGRDEEIIRVIEILNRRTKNNPVLIGEPGVGKTAVVEGLAQKIVDGNVPQKLQGKQVIRLDVVSLVQGTGIRGQFEERMQKLMEEIRQRQDVILFIDEIHEIVGAGNAGDGNMDAGNILKPALARGELQLVGATTLNEYRIIEKDAALERRMQPVKVDEPTVEETITILRGIQPKYQDYHHVKYTDEAITAAAELSNRYIQDRFLPDKAIDLLDEAGSKMNLTLNFIDPKNIDKRLIEAENLKAQATRDEDFEKAHPDVLHMFLQVLDDGRLTDGQGRTVSFKDTIIIMTSNAGTGKVEASVGFGATRENRTNSVLNQLGDFFSPEFMNRFDGIIEFSALSKENLLTIVDLMLDNVNQRLANNGIHLSVTEKVKEKLVDLGYDPKMGARPLRRTIQDHIEDAITDFYLENPNEKDLKAVMTSKGHITIKSAKKVEKNTQKAEAAKESD